MSRPVTTIRLDAEAGDSHDPTPLPGPLTTLLLDPLRSPELSQILTVLQGTSSLSFIRPNEEKALRARLGIPSDALIISVDVWNPLGWRGYRFVVRGTYVPATQNAATAPLFYLREETDPGKAWEDIPLVAWQRIVSCPDTPACIEARWHPTEGETIALHGLEQVKRLPEAQKGLRGLQLLREIERRGRPVGSTEYSEADLRKDYVDAYRKLQTMGVARPSQARVAEQLLISKRNFERYIKNYKLPWPPHA